MAATLNPKKSFTLVVFLLACSTLSYAALPDFKADTPEHLKMIQTAFEDAITYARAVALRWNPDCDPYLDRYFPSSQSDLVKGLFRTIANVPLDLDLVDPKPDPGKTEEVKKFLDTMKPDLLNEKFAKLSIQYGNHDELTPEEWEDFDHSCEKGKTFGSLSLLKTDITRGYMSLCPYLFDNVYSLKDVESPPAALTQKGIAGLGCDGLGNSESNYMLTTGETVLHELFHWPYLFKDVPGYDAVREDPDLNSPVIVDYDESLRPDVTVKNPELGYGAFFAHQIRNLPDTAPGGNGKVFVEAVNNADNYACYATMRLWGFVCEKEFAPVTSDDAWLARKFPNPQPPAKLANLYEGAPKQDRSVGCTANATSAWVVCH